LLARDQPQALVEIVLRQSAAIAALEQRVAQLEEVLREGGGPPGRRRFDSLPANVKRCAKRLGGSLAIGASFAARPKGVRTGNVGYNF